MKNFCVTLSIVLFIYLNKAHGAETGMPQLNPEFWTAQVFWLIIIFVSLYLFVGKVFLPKITYSIESRKSRIVNDLDEAQKLKEKAETKHKEYNEIIEKSKKEAKKIFDDAKKKLDQDIENKKKKFNDEIEKEITATEKEIKELKKNSISNINNISSEIAAEVIKKIIDVEVNKSNAVAVVNEISKKKAETFI